MPATDSFPVSSNPQTLALRELYATTGLSINDFAMALESTRARMSRILNGHEPVGDAMIGRIFRLMGPDAAAKFTPPYLADNDWSRQRQTRFMTVLERCEVSLLRAIEETPVTRPTRALLEDALAEAQLALKLVEER